MEEKTVADTYSLIRGVIGSPTAEIDQRHSFWLCEFVERVHDFLLKFYIFLCCQFRFFVGEVS